MGTQERAKFDGTPLPDEPHFTFLARDPHAPGKIRSWAYERERAIRRGEWPESDLPKIAEARELATAMEIWRIENMGRWRLAADEVQMSMRVVSTELGVVARETFPSGERAYRQNHDGSWNHSPDHKGPWIVVPTKDVPERFKDAIAAEQHAEAPATTA
jgi:hypothetical protein